MSRIALDTSAYSHFKRGQQRLIDLIDEAEWIGMPAIVLGELRTGFQLGKKAEVNHRELGAFIDNPVVHILDVDDEAARIYADIVVALRRAGTPLPSNDIWIAAVSAREGATVLTRDADFRMIGRVGAYVVPPT